MHFCILRHIWRGCFFIQFTQKFLYISNAVGLAGLPFFASLITNVLNISGNYIFVKFFGMGVGGTAFSTGLAALCVAIFYSTVLITQFKKNGVRIKGLYINKDELKFSVKFAFPTTLQQSVMYLCGALVSPLTNLCGAGAVSKVFLDSPDSIHYSVVFMRYCMPFVFFNMINNLLHAVFRSSGAGKYLVI